MGPAHYQGILGTSRESRDTEHSGIHGSSTLSGNVPGIPGHLAFRDPWVQHIIRESWGRPGNPGILSIQGSMGPGNPRDVP